ncbi:MAG: restriction endonuclease [Patescibacteria group bacterium]|nr:restriction endonuclease [Patescibacteria group bacterium]
MARPRIVKASGEIVSFSEQKLAESLRRAGASRKLISDTLRRVYISSDKKITSDALYHKVFNSLWRSDKRVAQRYSLKRAIMNLGPAGHVFESFVARIFQAHGYETRVSQVIPGKCVTHEIDVLARKGKKHYMIECKYHNQLGIRSDVKVALYTQSRFLDIKAAWERAEQGGDIHQGWLVTNTRPTTEAIAYAQCVGLRIVAWRYPADAGLEYFIESQQLYPVTILPSFPSPMVERASREGILLARDVLSVRPEDLSRMLMISLDQVRRIIEEAKMLD